MWDKFDFIEESEIEDLPDFDWHTSNDVVDRLFKI